MGTSGNSPPLFRTIIFIIAQPFKTIVMITFKGKEYETRTFSVICDGYEHDFTIADETLFEAISEQDEYLTDGTEAHTVDGEIYFYVEKGQLELSAEEICKDCLDVEMEFVEEL